MPYASNADLPKVLRPALLIVIMCLAPPASAYAQMNTLGTAPAEHVGPVFFCWQRGEYFTLGSLNKLMRESYKARMWQIGPVVWDACNHRPVSRVDLYNRWLMARQVNWPPRSYQRR